MTEWTGQADTTATISWKVPLHSKDLRRSFKLHASSVLGGNQEDYVPCNWRVQGCSQSWHVWDTDRLEEMLGRTIVVQYAKINRQEPVQDDPQWRNVYGDGGNPNAFERLLNVDRWNLRS